MCWMCWSMENQSEWWLMLSSVSTLSALSQALTSLDRPSLKYFVLFWFSRPELEASLVASLSLCSCLQPAHSGSPLSPSDWSTLITWLEYWPLTGLSPSLLSLSWWSLLSLTGHCPFSSSGLLNPLKTHDQELDKDIVLIMATDLLWLPLWPGAVRCLQKGLMADTVVTPGEEGGGASITSSLSLGLLSLQSPLGPPLVVTTSVSSVQFSSEG